MDRYDEQSALVVVDVQNDFADPSGALSVRGGRDIVTLVNDQIASARAAGALVVYTQDWHPPDTPHFAKNGGIWPVHCVRETWGAQLVPGLDLSGPIVRKGTGGEDGYSGFTVRDPDTGEATPTELAAILHERSIARIVVVGLATDYCVKETAADGARLGFTTEVLRDGVRAVDRQPGDGERALQELAAAGVAIS